MSIASENINGAKNLLQDCVHARPGERLLIVSEPDGAGYHDEHAPKLVEQAARELSLLVYQMQSSGFINNDQDKALLLDSLRGFDHIVFFSRVGDQIRFNSNDGVPPSTVCYTLDKKSLTSEFGTACHHGMSEIKQAVDDAFLQAEDVRVTCPRGTDYGGKPNWRTESTEVTIKRFPMLVPQPVPASGLSGRIALSRFLIGTGNRIYEPYYLALNDVVFACVEDNRIVEFDGGTEEVNSVEAHYRHVADQLSVEPWYVDSWHAGIHPGCNFEADAEADIMRWSGTAFGNPRILHFHTCGEYSPGEISWNLLDPTVTIDGVAIWEQGRLYPERLADGEAILARHPNLAELFNNPVREIGLTG